VSKCKRRKVGAVCSILTYRTLAAPKATARPAICEVAMLVVDVVPGKQKSTLEVYDDFLTSVLYLR
jgi:hypothetical protein